MTVGDWDYCNLLRSFTSKLGNLPCVAGILEIGAIWNCIGKFAKYYLPRNQNPGNLM